MNRKRRSALAVLRERNFRWFYIGQSTSMLGDGMVGVALAFAVLDLTGSPGDLGLVLAARTVPMIAVLLAGGVFADRLQRRRVMVVADVARFLSQGTMAALLLSGNASIAAFMLLQAVHGTSTALFSPASIGLMPVIVADDHLQQANALRGMAVSLGNTLGPALSGVLVAVASPGWALAADAATYAVSAVTLLLLRPPAHRPPPRESFLRGLVDGWIEFSSRSWVWGIVLLSAFANTLFAAFMVLGPAVAKLSLGGPAAWSAIMTAFGVGSVVGGIVAFRMRPRRPLLTGVLAVALLPLPILGMAAHLPAVGIAALAFLGGGGSTAFNAVWETTLQRNVPNTALSRVSAYDWFASFACQPVGQTTAGPVAAAIGIYPALWLAAIIQVLATIGTLAIPTIRHLPATADTQARHDKFGQRT